MHNSEFIFLCQWYDKLNKRIFKETSTNLHCPHDNYDPVHCCLLAFERIRLYPFDVATQNQTKAIQRRTISHQRSCHVLCQTRKTCFLLSIVFLEGFGLRRTWNVVTTGCFSKCLVGSTQQSQKEEMYDVWKSVCSVKGNKINLFAKRELLQEMYYNCCDPIHLSWLNEMDCCRKRNELGG